MLLAPNLFPRLRTYHIWKYQHATEDNNCLGKRNKVGSFQGKPKLSADGYICLIFLITFIVKRGQIWGKEIPEGFLDFSEQNARISEKFVQKQDGSDSRLKFGNWRAAVYIHFHRFAFKQKNRIFLSDYGIQWWWSKTRLPLVGGRKQILLSHMFGQKQEYTKEFSHIQTQTTSKPVRNQKNISSREIFVQLFVIRSFLNRGINLGGLSLL